MIKVMVFGTFDCLHSGHLHLFKQAKSYGEKLIVVLARDQNVEKIKGKLPLNNEADRLELVSALKIVDFAVLGDLADYLKAIRDYQPDVVCLGYDQINFVDELKSNFQNLKIIRLEPYQPNFYKSSKIKKII